MVASFSRQVERHIMPRIPYQATCRHHCVYRCVRSMGLWGSRESLLVPISMVHRMAGLCYCSERDATHCPGHVGQSVVKTSCSSSVQQHVSRPYTSLTDEQRRNHYAPCTFITFFLSVLGHKIVGRTCSG